MSGALAAQKKRRVLTAGELSHALAGGGKQSIDCNSGLTWGKGYPRRLRERTAKGSYFRIAAFFLFLLRHLPLFCAVAHDRGMRNMLAGVVMAMAGFGVWFSAGAQAPTAEVDAEPYSAPAAYPETYFPLEIVWPRNPEPEAQAVNAEDWVGHFAPLLDSADLRAEAAAVEGLAQLPPEEAAGELLNVLPRASEAVRPGVWEALGELPGDVLAAELLVRLVAGDGTLWESAVDRLPALRGQLEPALMRALADGGADVELRIAAADLLGAMGSWAAMPILVDTAWTADAPLARAATAAVAKTRPPGSTPELAGLSSHDDPEIRRMALEGLADGADSAAVERLTAVMLGDEPLPELRVLAAGLLGRSASREAVEPLIRALRAEPQVAQAALGSLQALTGQDLGPAQPDWVRWYEATRQDPAAGPILVPGGSVPPSVRDTGPPPPLTPQVPPGFDPTPDIPEASDRSEPAAPRGTAGED